MKTFIIALLIGALIPFVIISMGNKLTIENAKWNCQVGQYETVCLKR